MVRKILLLVLFFYFLVLIQNSFLIHFVNLPNLVLIFVGLINILEDKTKKAGLISAVIGGFFLDMFSSQFIGYYILIAVLIAVSIKFILKKYARW
jgi:rod shape-determining protein MreD